MGANINNDSASARIRTTSVSTSDEGIVVDYKDDAPRKKRVSISQQIYSSKVIINHLYKKIKKIKTTNLKKKIFFYLKKSLSCASCSDQQTV